MQLGVSTSKPFKKIIIFLLFFIFLQKYFRGVGAPKTPKTAFIMFLTPPLAPVGARFFFPISDVIRYCQRAFPTENMLGKLVFFRLRRDIFKRKSFKTYHISPFPNESIVCLLFKRLPYVFECNHYQSI